MSKRGSSGFSLCLGIDKPAGMTSHDVVNRIRRVFGERRVGHGGTLDPFATGVLPIFVGSATRLAGLSLTSPKTYVAEIAFGFSTNTGDTDGEVVDEKTPPSNLLSIRFAEDSVSGLIGKMRQIPPAYSAVKVNGVRAYERARQGEDVKLKARDIQIFDARLLEPPWMDDDGCAIWPVEISVSAGTYVRKIAEDLGDMYGCPAHLRSLRRTETLGIGISECIPLDELCDVSDAIAIDPVSMLGKRCAFVSGGLERAVANGSPISAKDLDILERIEAPKTEDASCAAPFELSNKEVLEGEGICMLSSDKLLAIYEMRDGKLMAKRVFSNGISRWLDVIG